MTLLILLINEKILHYYNKLLTVLYLIVWNPHSKMNEVFCIYIPE